MPFDFTGGNHNEDDSTQWIDSSSERKDKPRGFSNRPTFTRHGTEEFYEPSNGFQNQADRPGEDWTSGRNRVKKPFISSRRSSLRPTIRNSRPMVSIPWNIILPVIGVVALLVLCFLNREAITMFLREVFGWILIILVMAYILKLFLFGGRRR